jgi:hypothetical protein
MGWGGRGKGNFRTRNIDGWARNSGWLTGDGYLLVGGAGLVPHPFLIGFGTAGQGRSRQRFRQQGIGFRGRHHHPGMVGGIYPEMVREVPKAEPRFVR